jgi:FtsP/CotA-like multicopper oxidase with cupredoxin domain
MQPGTAEILPGLQTPILGYDGRFPGPTIRATRGRAVEVRQRNAGGRELNVHLHGGVTPPQFDGHPHDGIPNGTERLYKYPNIQRAATLWYHDHAHGQTAKTLFAGLAAFYVVEDPDEAELDLPQGEYDVPLMIQDRSFNADGSFRYRLDLDRGFRGDTILVNGAVAPRMRVERRLYRLRFLNASNARAYALALGNNRPLTQIASDAGLLPKPVKRTSLPLEPAERADVVVDFRDFGIGSKVILHNTIGEATTQAVMRFDVVRGGREHARVPKRLTELEDLPPVNAQRGWPLTFQGLGTSMWQIAGAGFDALRIDCRPRQGTTELWTFTNNSQRTHPMHLHGYHFRVVSTNGRPPHPGDAAWKDTVAVYPNQTVVVRPYFDYFAGRYVFHCHAAEHGDMSMMGQMEVVA